MILKDILKSNMIYPVFACHLMTLKMKENKSISNGKIIRLTNLQIDTISYLGCSLIIGIIISSNEMPPC